MAASGESVGLGHGLCQRDLRPGQNRNWIDHLQDILHALDGRCIHKTENHALHGLVPKRYDHQMTDADLPLQGSRYGVVKNPGHSRDIHHDLYIGSHWDDCNVKRFECKPREKPMESMSRADSP